MAKKTAHQIKSYYQKVNVVDGYNDRRFWGLGGKYIHHFEVKCILDEVSKVVHEDSAVLDLGAGRGRLTRPLTVLLKDVFALERSDEMIKYLLQCIPKERILVQSVFDSFKSKKRFDIITSLRFFEHFDRADQFRILQNANVCQKKGDYLIYATVNKNSLEGFIASFFPYGRYNYFLSTEETNALFDSAGYKPIAVNRHFIFPRGFFLVIQKIGLAAPFIELDRYLSRLLPHLGCYQVLVLKKL